MEQLAVYRLHIYCGWYVVD